MHTETHSEHRASGNNSCDPRNTCLLPGEGDKWEVIDPSIQKKKRTQHPKLKDNNKKTQQGHQLKAKEKKMKKKQSEEEAL